MKRAAKFRRAPRRVGVLANKPRNRDLELQLQGAFVDFIARHFPHIRRRMWFVNNGAHLAGNKGQRIGTMMKLKRAGLTAGVLDLHVILPCNTGRLGVMDAKIGDEDLTDSQIEWCAHMSECGVLSGTFNSIPAGLALLRLFGFTEIRVTDMGGGALHVHNPSTPDASEKSSAA